MKAVFLAAVLAASGMAGAQNLALPEPMKMAPQAAQGGMDAAETPMLAAEDNGGGAFRKWYAGQKRPAVVVYFNRELGDLPAGWEGSKRLLIEDTISGGGKADDKRTITVGMQHNTQRQSRVRSQFAKLFEQSLSVELKKQDVRLLDATVLHRKTAAGGRGADIEYESLSRSARFVFEVELLVVNGEVEAVGNLKDLRSGEVAASVRQKVDSLENTTEIDRVNRKLVQRLMQYKA